MVEKLTLLVAIVLSMAGMGSTLTRAKVMAVFRRPKAVLVGFACQYGLLPLVAVGLVHLFDLSGALALGLILVGCSPGGVASNIFAYFARANVALSIAMTALSTVTAWFMMPMLLLIYASPYTSETPAIPYRELAAGLMVMLVPVGIGMLVRKRNVEVAAKLERIGGFAGIFILAYLAVTWFPKHGHILQDAGAWVAAGGLLCVIGILSGYVCALASGLSLSDRRTVSLETGLQNAALTITIIILAFEGDIRIFGLKCWVHPWCTVCRCSSPVPLPCWYFGRVRVMVSGP